MADELTTTWTDLLYEMRGPLQEAYPKDHVLSAELDRDTDRKNFSGNQVRVPIFEAPLQGAQGIAEAGTVTEAQPDDTSQAHIKMAHAALPIRISPELMKQTVDNAAAKALATKVKRARQSLARLENEQLNGDGTGKLADITDAATSLTITVGAGANWRQLYPGRIVDIRVAATGADPGQGLKRKIDSVNRTTGVITFLTGAFGGGSGGIVHAATDDIYIVDTYGNACQGIQQIGAVTGTFEDINKATNAFWQGTDGRDGATADVDPTLGVLDLGFLVWGERTDLEKADLCVGDPGVILKFEQLFYAATRFEMGKGKLETGFEGPSYHGMVMVGDFDHERKALSFLVKESLQMYGYGKGPDWDDLTGAMFQRFGRTRPVEAWLVDDYQLGAHECRTMMRYKNLNRAA